ncbi:MAG: A/G-specific adenine glycosylase [Candidatus Binatia bacterium]
MPAKNFSTVRRRLLTWYKHHQRNLPWRKTTDPYAIWVSETMLQQTQVKTVVPYYERFLNRFPNVEALARAPLDRVLHVWAGLGYYRRAENLKTAARQVMRDYGGKLPSEHHQLRALPGIGDYTAGALLSIAFGKNSPAIDGNVRRVLGRLDSTYKETQIRALATQLVAGKRPGDVNQALMELGATLCTPKTPDCGACPLGRECRSRSRDSKISARRVKRISFTDVVWPLAIVRSGGKILLRRRNTGKLLARLWELPGQETPGRGDAVRALRRELRDFAITSRNRRSIGEIRHAITYRRIRAPIYLFECASDSIPAQSQWRWLSLADAGRYPISTLSKKALALLAVHETRSA